MINLLKLIFLCGSLLAGCADEQPYLPNQIKRASDAILVPCDPYNLGRVHSCLVFASAYMGRLVIWDATVEEFVLAPNPHGSLNIEVGPATNNLARVNSAQAQFPYFLALDQAIPALFAVRAFPTKDKKRSFTTPKTQILDKKAPYQIAAFQSAEHVVAIITYRDDKSIGLWALDSASGLIDPQIKPLFIPLGVKPSHVVIDAERQFALISDEGSPVIHHLDLSNIKEVLNGAKAMTSTINIGAPASKIYLQARDFGNGIKNYVAALRAEGKELRLVNITDKKVEDIKALKDHPQALYFPDAKSEPCCGGKKNNWLAVADIKGKLFHYVIKNTNAALSLEENSPVDLFAEKHLALSQLQLATIIGGRIEVDSSLNKPMSCPPHNRKMFFIASWGSERPRSWTGADAIEVEAQGYSCEGESGASRFGYKRE